MKPDAVHIKISGLVQGVGFRPYVYRLAIRNNIKGWVENNNEGVSIHAEGTTVDIEHFIEALHSEAPKASFINHIARDSTPFEGFTDFSIRSSSNRSDEVTEVSPDIAVCDDCLNDMKLQPHRKDYLFTNCTNCGPRFTIIRDLPYDRRQTTMAPFVMCSTCRSEYTNILDRRFHAQPVACLNCGPHYVQLYPQPDEPEGNFPGMIAELIDNGKVLAIKGMGGYHLLCDAQNENAVKLLRQRKQREGKPVAVMMADVNTARKYFEINSEEEELLLSWRRPIVLVRNRTGLAPSVSNGMHTTGLLLPYMPLHHYMFRFLNTDAVVFTSANMSDDPVVIDDDEALRVLPAVADVVVSANREIHNRADDSVAMVAAGRPMLIRRSRGYVPSPVMLHFHSNGILATGAELNNTFAIGKGKQAILSQHIGDLKNAATLGFFEQSLDRFRRLFRFEPALVACDLHPDYLSTRYALGLGIQTVIVQHHHAHMASCMAENGLEEPVIGLIFDGTGLGSDGTIWGGECLVGDYHGFNRVGYLEAVPLPGGDAVTHQPWRTAFSYLWKYYGDAQAIAFSQQRGWCSEQMAHNLISMLRNSINCPPSSGAGRLFDAVAALTGICTTTSFHAEAPMRLEAMAGANHVQAYNFDTLNGVILLQPLFDGLLTDLANHVTAQTISARFHYTVAQIICHMARQASADSGLNKVVLSGGTFQNRRLIETSLSLLQKSGFQVFMQHRVPCNDGGIALGQLAIAAAGMHKV
jgi:hydrogenase maturation protein HypF